MKECKMKYAVSLFFILTCVSGCKTLSSEASSSATDKTNATNSVSASNLSKTSASSSKSNITYSGFLGDGYSQMKPAKAASGEPVMRWVSPKLKRGVYDQIMMEPTVFYPDPEPSKKVPATTLKDVLNYFDGGLGRQLYTVMPVIKNPSAARLASKAQRTLKLRVAITAVSTKASSVEDDDMITLGLSSFSAKTQPVTMYAEYEIIDAATDEVMALGMRKGFGKPLKSKTDIVKLDNVKPILDIWIKDAAVFFKALK